VIVVARCVPKLARAEVVTGTVIVGRAQAVPGVSTAASVQASRAVRQPGEAGSGKGQASLGGRGGRLLL
jgi:hypothetical protein